MYYLILVLHILVVITLIAVILVQRGRSGGLVEALGGVESIFGTKTSSFFVKATVVLAVLFFITSISLAYLAKERGKSIMDKFKDTPTTKQDSASEKNSSTQK
jgi:preprotein translocase subunit SecG